VGYKWRSLLWYDIIFIDFIYFIDIKFLNNILKILGNILPHFYYNVDYREIEIPAHLKTQRPQQ